MLVDPNQRQKMKYLAKKIRDHEKDFGTPRSQVVLDQIDSTAAYCDAVPEFSEYIDGFITENFEAIVDVVNGRTSCP